jgi:hypothetical protein
MLLILPLRVYVSKKKVFTLNLNEYRNAHFSVLAAAKTNYSAIVMDLVQKARRRQKTKRRYKKARLHFVYYHGSAGAIDVSNPCSIIDKFATDALVKAQLLSDDNVGVIDRVNYAFGGIDRDNPRCELTVEEVFDDRDISDADS